MLELHLINNEETRKQLESDGWKFLRNEDLNNYYKFIETELMDFPIPVPRETPLTDEELCNKYAKDYKEVKVIQGCDIYGKPVEDFRAVYVKK